MKDVGFSDFLRLEGGGEGRQYVRREVHVLRLRRCLGGFGVPCIPCCLLRVVCFLLVVATCLLLVTCCLLLVVCRLFSVFLLFLVRFLLPDVYLFVVFCLFGTARTRESSVFGAKGPASVSKS